MNMKSLLIQIISTIVGGIMFSIPAAAQEQRQATASDTVVGRKMDAPVNRAPVKDKFWWSDDWFERGKLDKPVNYEVTSREASYINPEDDTEVPATIYRPEKEGKYPAILFQHGRRGLDVLTRRLAIRMAARGFVVLAPDIYQARFIERYPVNHEEISESDVNAGVDYLLSLDDVSTSRICFYSHTRGGYYTLMVAVRYKRQQSDVACYVSFYPHWQNPNAPEPLQVYRYAPELDKLDIPAMVFIGEYEQYQRRRTIETAVEFMKKANKDVRLIIYPGVGRGFDFRPAEVRTFADYLATRDSNLRTAEFIRRHLEEWRTK